MNIKMILACAAAVVAVAGFGSIRAVTHDPWGGNPNAWQMKRHNEKMQQVRQGGAKVVFIGDSITHFWESNGREQLKKYFSEGDMKMLDLGTSADRTEHVLWRLNEGQELDGYEAKCILLMIGTNNTGHFPRAKETPADTILGIKKILETIKAKQPKAKVVLTAIFPRGQKADDGNRLRNDVVNREIRKFADGKTVFWCDMADRFLEADGTLPKSLFPDSLHPSAAGYEIWHECVKPYIDYALSDGTGPAPQHLVAKSTAETGPVSVVPDARTTDAWWMDRLLQKRNQIADAQGEFDVVFFGDSITHGWEGAGRKAYDELCKTYKILNIGYGGDRTEHLVWRGLNGELDGYKAKCIMLMIGTNNTWHRKDKPEDIAAGIRRVLDVIAQKQPQAKVLLLPIFPFGDNPQHWNRVNNEKANALIRPFADGEKVVWVDFNAKFLDEKGDNAKWMPDHCHPNLAGYTEIWMPAVLPYFKEICGK